MPSFTTIFTAAAMLSSVMAVPVPNTGNKIVASEFTKRNESDWAVGYLESYETYHIRYLALDCQDQHNTTFFDECCHPLLSTEDLSSRPSYCTPSANATASASAHVLAVQANATATISASGAAETGSSDEEDDDEDYDDEDDEDEDADEQYCDEASTISAQVASYEATATVSASVVTLTSSSTTQAVDVNANIYNGATSSAESWSKSSSTTAAPSKTSTTSEWSEPTTSTSATSTSSASGSTSTGTVETGGYATYFYQGGNAGACGTVHSDSDLIIAIDQAWWPDFSQASDLCGKSITLTNTDNGKSVTATVADVCPTCDTDNSLDLSVGAFEAIADLSAGEVPITWYFD